MAISVGPEMTFFRWILSHLMLIVVLSLIIYVYWNRSEIWPENASAVRTTEQAIEVSATQPIEAIIPGENDISEQAAATLVASMQAIDVVQEEVLIVDLSEADESQGNGSDEDFEVVISQFPSLVLSPHNASIIVKEGSSKEDSPKEESTKENSFTEDKSETQTKKLHQQIRSRQKQLQSQMVMLIPFDSDKNMRSSKKLKAVQPVINTPEQRILLKEARKAFDKQKFNQAEKKYLQIIKQLPELPDIVGELANVYRTQNKTSEYLAANTQFVKRLVAHNRFNEAWKIVHVTDKLDKEAAEQQRKIIKSRQEEQDTIKKQNYKK